MDAANLTDYTNPVTITVFTGTIGSNQTIAYRSAPAALSFISGPSGGTTPYSYQWQRSNNLGSTYSNVSGATQAVYSPQVLGQTTMFRCRVTDGANLIIYTNFVTITVLPNLIPGTIGSAQTICYNTAPAGLTGPAATGGTSPYSYQWQYTIDGLSWSNIIGATAEGYTPNPLVRDTWYRRFVSDATGRAMASNTIRITVSPQIGSAQLHDNITIDEYTSTNFNVAISGGTSPYTINYTRNGIAQTAVNNYVSGTNISTGVLIGGVYTYALTSVADANGCVVQSLGTNITIWVGSPSGKALVMTNSSSGFYSHFADYIKVYLINFGIPFDEYDVNLKPSPSSEFLNRYSIIIFGHRNVYSSGNYPITALETALNNGVGLYSFDPYLFDDPNPFINSEFTAPSQQTSSSIFIDPSHYITQTHEVSVYEPQSNIIHLRSDLTASQNSSLAGASNLAVVSSDGYISANILQASTFSNGRIVKWSEYGWVFENVLGPVYGMDDLIWRGIVWAARKPFVMQGMPPLFTMRVDDVYGDDGDGINNNSVADNFQWINICNTYNILPWCGLFTGMLDQNHIDLMHALLFDNKATAAPHAIDPNGYYGWIYYDYSGEGYVDPSVNTAAAKVFMDTHFPGHTSKFMVPHSYAIASEALPGIHDMGIEFILTPVLVDHTRISSWLNLGPYRINRNGINWPEDPSRPLYYEGSVSWPFEGTNYDFFICGSEIRDVDSYDWWPSNNVYNSVQSAIRQLRRGLNSMVLPTLFTHEYSFGLYLTLTPENWNSIFHDITTAINAEYPDIQYLSMDDAMQYVRAKHNLKITNVADDLNNVYVSYSGNNDMNTRCYLFTETGGVISYRFLNLTQISTSDGTRTLSFSK
jgi:hypothetical protein